ncbi:MAG TPA: peptidylprolyl isomerase [Pirellulales bacterium]|jgi:peptidyl-prolyl cis-trans isomerase A (cyclophilin A)
MTNGFFHRYHSRASLAPLAVAVLTVFSFGQLLAESAQALPIATFDTSLGSFQVELRSDVAPLTVENFINYVDTGAYNNTFIHRSIADFIIQGGGYTANGAPFPYTTIPAHITQNAPVQNEFNLSNTAGTLAMALLSGNPNSATSEWFFNLVDNSSNLDTQNGGFTVFGDVLGNGMSVLDAIAAVPTYNASGIWGGAFANLPLQNFDVNNTTNQITAANLILINSVTITAPEPAAGILLLSGGALVGTGMRLRKRRRQQIQNGRTRHAGDEPVCAKRENS